MSGTVSLTYARDAPSIDQGEIKSEHSFQERAAVRRGRAET